MGDIQIGNLGSVSQIYAGSTEIAQVYVGSTLIWEGGAPPVPIPTSGLTGWYGDKVNSGVDRTTLANGAAITQWDDLSGNGWHLTGTSGQYPTYNSSTDGIAYDGVNQHLLNTNFNGINGANKKTFFHVFKLINPATNDSILSLGNSNTTTNGGFILQIYNNADLRITHKGSGSRADFNNANYVNNTQYLQTTYYVNNNVFGARARLNGSDLTRTGANNYTLATTQGITTNGRWGSTDGWTNTFVMEKEDYEIILYDRELSTTEIQEVELYLNNKYSIY